MAGALVPRGGAIGTTSSLFNFQMQVEGNYAGRLEAFAFAVMPIATQGWLQLAMQPFLQKRVEQRFATEGDEAVGGKWVPLTEATQQIRLSKGYAPDHPINVRTGELKQYAMTSDVSVQGDVMATLQMPGSGDVNPELRKKLFTAQAGWVDPGGSVTPPRPVLGLSTRDLIFAINSLSMFIQAAVMRAR